MESIYKNILDTKTNVNIIGNIFICDELCNLELNYKDHNIINLIHNGIILEINYNDKSFVTYNGGEEFGSQAIEYYLKKIMMISPPKHFIQNNRRNNGIELYLIHESEDKKRYQILSILLYGSDECADKKSIQYKLFSELTDIIPLKAEKQKSKKLMWNINDLLPENKSFYTYNSPTDIKVNWIVFKQEVCVPSEFINKFHENITNIKENEEIRKKLLDVEVPINPKNLILFGHQVTKSIPLQCLKQPSINETKDDQKDITKDITKDTIEDKIEDTTKDKTEDVDADKPLSDKIVEKKDNKKSDDEKPDEEDESPDKWSWVTWIIVIFAILAIIFIFTSFILFIWKKNEIFQIQKMLSPQEIKLSTFRGGADISTIQMMVYYYTTPARLTYKYIVKPLKQFTYKSSGISNSNTQIINEPNKPNIETGELSTDIDPGVIKSNVESNISKNNNIKSNNSGKRNNNQRKILLRKEQQQEMLKQIMEFNRKN